MCHTVPFSQMQAPCVHMQAACSSKEVKLSQYVGCASAVIWTSCSDCLMCLSLAFCYG